mmetsp:Transcript_18120/g.44461  ORF Transcript_18120/g.44461 Transcript_18120/m.44461 type:complete len:180 (+) Transcript_18120:163-702(+)
MDNVSLPSGLSSASSRSEHITYMTAELGLDQPTAAMLYRAERLQEKGQLQQALSYFARVAERKPDCVEAVENAHMIRSMLAEQPPSQEAPPCPLQTVSEYQTVEMQVEWEGAENIFANMATVAATSTATPTPPATAPSAHAPTAPAAPEWAGAGHGVEAGERVYEELVEQADGSLLACT